MTAAPQAPSGQQAEPTDEQIDAIDLRAINNYETGGGWLRAYARKVLALAGHQSERPAPAEMPSDGDFLRWAEREGAKVNWNPDDSAPCIVFTMGSQWGRFCDRVRALASAEPSHE